MWRWIAALLGASTPAVAEQHGLVPLVQTNSVEDHQRTSDLRCGALYAALKKLSETGQTGNSQSYGESAALFVGFGVRRMMETENLDRRRAEKEAGEIVRGLVEAYWGQMVSSGSQLGEVQEPPPTFLDADIKFCLERGEAYADGRSP